MTFADISRILSCRRPHPHAPRGVSPTMIRTKIVATLCPACSDIPTLTRLFDAGVDVCRINFSHGNLDTAHSLLQAVQAAMAKHGAPIAVLGDLGGPKIRLGPVRDEAGAGGMPVAVGDTLVIQRDPVE